MAWTNVTSTTVYKRYIRANEDKFSDELRQAAQTRLRQSRLAEWADVQA